MQHGNSQQAVLFRRSGVFRRPGAACINGEFGGQQHTIYSSMEIAAALQMQVSNGNSASVRPLIRFFRLVEEEKKTGSII